MAEDSLGYADPSARWGIVCERTDEGLRIVVPAESWYRGALKLIGWVLLIPISIFCSVAIALVVHEWRDTGVSPLRLLFGMIADWRRLPWPAMKNIGMFFGIFGFLIGIVTWKRGYVIEVTPELFAHGSGRRMRCVCKREKIQSVVYMRGAIRLRGRQLRHNVCHPRTRAEGLWLLETLRQELGHYNSQ